MESVGLYASQFGGVLQLSSTPFPPDTMHSNLGSQSRCMSESFGPQADPSRFDIEFSVPMTHRLRFTQDCLGQDFDVLLDLLEHGNECAARVQVWIDDGLAANDPNLIERLSHQFESATGVELVSKIECLPGGEVVKNDPHIIDHLLSAFNQADLDRRSYVIVIGGGAVLDAVGYAAAIAHRGIRLIRLPTTTLAQADSGVGVKNAVNWFDKKNWKGTFATPWAVVNDQRLLDGLSDRDFRCGFSEAVKVALLKDPEFFNFLHDTHELIALRSPTESAHALRQSVLLHLWHITRGGDPFENRQARPLDFGHWSAHKLEAITNYGLRHGEAVSIGVAVDVAYSFLTQHLPLDVAEKTFETLQGLHLPIWDESLQDGCIFDGLEEFRQHLGGELTITLISDAGQSHDVHTIYQTGMEEAIQMVAEYNNAHSIT